MHGLVFLPAICFVAHVEYVGAYPKDNYGASSLQLTILHTNDIHSRILESDKRGNQCPDFLRDRSKCFGGVARIAHKVKEIKSKQKNTLFLNAGDFYQGTLWYSILKDKIASFAMSRMYFDAICLGNHEFDDGPAGLVPFLRAMYKAGVPVLGTNLDTSGEPLFRGINLPKSLVLKIQGHRVALLGVDTTETMTIAKPGGVKILPEVHSINTETNRLKQQGINTFILISHVGFDVDQHLARHCPDLDLIVGGHTNTFLYTDQKFLRALMPYKRIVDAAIRKVVGSTKVLLEANEKICRFMECNSINLMADSFLDFYTNRRSKLDYAWSDYNAAVVNGGMARDSIRENSNVTLGDLLGAMPYDSELVTMNMTGAQLYQMFEYGVSNFTWWPDLNGKFLQVSGMRVIYDLARPNDRRVAWLGILCARCRVPRYHDVLPNRRYHIITTSFIANGGDGFRFDKSIYKYNEGFSSFDIFTKYFTKMSPIKTPEEGRVIVRNLPPKPKTSSPGSSPTGGFVYGITEREEWRSARRNYLW
ncbi:protein 5NUC-like isoform X2 [Haemaphysalis longicornis]